MGKVEEEELNICRTVAAKFSLSSSELLEAWVASGIDLPWEVLGNGIDQAGFIYGRFFFPVMADDRVDYICGRDCLPSALPLGSMLGCSSNSKHQRLKTTSREVNGWRGVRNVWVSYLLKKQENLRTSNFFFPVRVEKFTKIKFIEGGTLPVSDSDWALLVHSVYFLVHSLAWYNLIKI